MKLVSVIIPCYNQAHFLSEAIESVLSQTYRNFEIIVVDDGSSDNTFEVATRYLGVRYIRQENKGQGAARNTGLRESKGDYLVFLDSDDRLLPEALEIGINCLDAHTECAFVYGRIKLITSDGSPLPTPEEICIERDHYLNLLYWCYIYIPASVMFRRNVFESVIGFNPSLSPAEDWDLYLRITKIFPIYCHNKEVAEYRRHSQNSSRNSARMLKSCMAVLRSQWGYIKGNKKYEEKYKLGIKEVHDCYGEALVAEFRSNIIAWEWKQALKGLATLIHYYPKGVVKLFNHKYQKRSW